MLRHPPLVVVVLLLAAGAGCRREARPPEERRPPRAPLAFEHDVLALKLAFGTRASARMPVVGPRAAAAQLRPRPATHPQVRARVLSPDPVIAVDVTAAREENGLPVGVHVGNIVVDTGVPDAPRLTLPYSIRVTGTLEVSPTNPYFNMRDPAAHERTLVVRTTAPDLTAFAVTEAKVVSGPFTATVEKAGPKVFHVHVRLRPEAVPPDERGVLGRLIILSNDPTEPTKEIPLVGLGRLNDQPQIGHD